MAYHVGSRFTQAGWSRSFTRHDSDGAGEPSSTPPGQVRHNRDPFCERTTSSWPEESNLSPTDSNISSFNISEVRRIIGNVNEEVKKRREKELTTKWEISDLEAQLETLQRTTREVCESTATVGEALSWTMASVDKLANEFENFKVQVIEPAKQEHALLIEQKAEVETLVAALNAQLDEVESWGVAVESRAAQLLLESKAVLTHSEASLEELDRRLEIAHRNDELQILTCEEEARAHAWHEEQRALIEREQMLQEQLDTSQRAWEEQQILDENINLALEDRCSCAVEQTTRIEVEIHEIAERHAALKLELATNDRNNGWQGASVEEIRVSIGATLSEIVQMELQVGDREESLHALQLAYMKQELEIEDLIRRCKVEEKTLISSNAELAILRETVAKVETANDGYFAMACSKLHELKELHQWGPFFRMRLEQAKRRCHDTTWELASKVVNRSAEVHRLKIVHAECVRALNEEAAALRVAQEGLAFESEEFRSHYREEDERAAVARHKALIEVQERMRNAASMLEEDELAKAVIIEEADKITAELTRHIKQLEEELVALKNASLPAVELSVERKMELQAEVEQEMAPVLSEIDVKIDLELEELRRYSNQLDEKIGQMRSEEEWLKCEIARQQELLAEASKARAAAAISDRIDERGTSSVFLQRIPRKLVAVTADNKYPTVEWMQDDDPGWLSFPTSQQVFETTSIDMKARPLKRTYSSRHRRDVSTLSKHFMTSKPVVYDACNDDASKTSMEDLFKDDLR